MATNPEDIAAEEAAIQADSDDDLPTPFSQAVEWLVEKWGEARACPYCGNTSWTVFDPVTLAVGSFGDGSMGLATLHPMFFVTCTNCGNTVFINAEQAGLLGGAAETVELATEEPSDIAEADSDTSEP